MSFVQTPQNISNKGHSSIKFILRKNDPEIALKSVPTRSEYTYEFSLFLPQNIA